jgi:hypothetical protein
MATERKSQTAVSRYLKRHLEGESICECDENGFGTSPLIRK